jgi:hypothetical protein
MNNTNPGAGGANSYGVQIPMNDGSVTGYAWSENVGWISFNAGDLAGCPSAPCSAQRASNKLTGWARIVGIENELAAGNSGGWKGWIKLSSVSGDPTAYGIQINADGTITKGATTSYAWSDELGWVDFSKATVTAVNNLKICRLSCNSGGLVSSSTAETMVANEQRNYKACYNTSAVCDTNTGDVTGTAAWTDNNTPNNVVTVSGGTITAGTTAGSEGIAVSYNPGSGNINTSFNVNVSAPICLCNNAAAAASTCTTDTYNDSCGNQVCAGTKTTAPCNNNGGYIETTP